MSEKNTSWYQPLFNHMAEEHKLILTSEEMSEIIQIVSKMFEADAERWEAYKVVKDVVSSEISEGTAIKLTKLFIQGKEAAKQHSEITERAIELQFRMFICDYADHQLKIAFSYTHFDLNYPFNYFKYLFIRKSKKAAFLKDLYAGVEQKVKLKKEQIEKDAEKFIKVVNENKTAPSTPNS